MSVCSRILWGLALTNSIHGGVEVPRSSLDRNLEKERKQWAIESAFKTAFRQAGISKMTLSFCELQDITQSRGRGRDLT